jgi:sugar lactone lactonase YvrE
MPRKTAFGLCLLALSWAVSSAGAFAQGGEAPAWLSHVLEASKEHRAKNYPAALEAARKAVSHGPPRHPELLFHLARAHSLNGQPAEASTLLGTLADMGLGVDVAGDGDFKTLRASAEWAGLSRKIAAASAPLVRSRAAFRITDPELLPEGIAYDSRRRAFYLGSIYKSKIIRVDADGRARDFKATGEDGLSSVLGLRADERRRLLWVCNNNERDGAAFVHKYELDTGRLIRKYTLGEGAGPRQANDLVFNRRGDAYVTDSLGSAVYEIPADGEPRLLAKLARGVYPNGIAFSRDERRLFVANFAGITVIDLAAQTQTPLAYAEHVAVTGADGLYLYGNSLVAIQNAHRSPDRVVRLFLNAAGDRVESARVLESNHPLYALPTTGVVVGDDLFYMANTHIQSLGPDGKFSPTAKLRDVVVLRLRLK